MIINPPLDGLTQLWNDPILVQILHFNGDAHMIIALIFDPYIVLLCNPCIRIKGVILIPKPIGKADSFVQRGHEFSINESQHHQKRDKKSDHWHTPVITRVDCFGRFRKCSI